MADRIVGAANEALAAGHYSAVIEHSNDAILTKDRHGLIMSWNPAAERMYGYSAAEAVGQPISIIIPSTRRGEERRILDRVLAGERIDHYETVRRRKDGREIIVELTVSPIRDESGTVVSASVIARDQTERRRSRLLSQRLHDLTAALSREITPQRVVATLMEQSSAALGADAASVGLVDRERSQIELAGHTGYSEHGMERWSSFSLAVETPMSTAVHTGDPVWTMSSAELLARYPVFEGGADALTFESLAVIPLTVEGVTFGALALSFTESRTFDPHERSFLLAVAQQAAQTLERARLYEIQRITSERLSFLAEASELLAGSLDPDAALRRLAELSVSRIADWCGIELVDEEGRLRNVAVAHANPAKLRLAEVFRSRYPIDAEATRGVGQVIRSGEPELYEDVTDEMLVEAAVDDEHLRLMRELGLGSVMIVPLAARGRVFGAVTFVASGDERRYDSTDLDLAEDLARRAALAIDNSMLFRREHEAAVTLQRSLLPQSLPEIEGIEFAARYEPAAPGLEVGGDWYEVVPREDGTVGVIIGDVAGRGIRAASVMGRVRPTLRAYVADGHGPQESIERLDRVMKEAERPEMTTVFQLHYDPETESAEYVRAGHPPALLRLPDGSVEQLAGSGTPPLGIIDGFGAHPHRVEVPPGSLLLLYTDGLIERRGESLDAELAQLKLRLARAPQAAGDCLAWLADELGADSIPDDVAMLAMRTGA